MNQALQLIDAPKVARHAEKEAPHHDHGDEGRDRAQTRRNDAGSAKDRHQNGKGRGCERPPDHLPVKSVGFTGHNPSP